MWVAKYSSTDDLIPSHVKEKKRKNRGAKALRVEEKLELM